MILSASQPCYLPWAGFWNKLVRSDLYVILDSVQFEKGSYTNRTKIKTAQGEHWLTIPVKKGANKLSIKDVGIACEDSPNGMDDYIKWKADHWTWRHLNTIRHNYIRTPYFDIIDDWVDMSVGWPTDLSFLSDSVKDLGAFMGVDYMVALQSAIGVTGHKQDLIINLCRHYNADAFLFGAMGRDYIDEDELKDAGIEPIFQDFKCIEYPQQWGGPFIPGLSIIDALFNVGPGKTLDLIKGGYKLPEKYLKGEGK